MGRVETVTAVVLIAASAVACSRPERPVLEAFFNSSREGDVAALRSISTITFKPHEQGVVTKFDIVSVAEEGDTKTVKVSADVKRPDGHVVSETLLVMMENRAALDPGHETAGRPGWLITGLIERPR